MRGALQSLPVVGKAFMDLRPEEVWAFWRHMQDHYRTTVVNKRDALEMQLVAQVLDALRIQSSDRFLKNYTTTFGRKLYTPFEVGKPQSGWDLWSQVLVCVHEHQHVVQHEREGLNYEVSYLSDRAARARWEAEAYRCNLELHYWRYGVTPAVRPLASLLTEYGCRPIDVEVTAQNLALSAASVRRGAIINEATNIALLWLNEHVPHLRAKAG